MGKIVGSFGTGHVVMGRYSAGEAGERAFAGMREIGRRATVLKPDVVVIISSEHYYNFHASETAVFSVGLGASFDPYGDMDLPKTPVAGKPEFAKTLLEIAQTSGFPLISLNPDYKLDHGVMIPYLTLGKPRPAIVPIISNVGLDEPPTMRQAFELGALIRSATLSMPDNERVVVMGTGGLSHWLAVPEMGRVNATFDNEVLDAMASGESQRLGDWSTQHIVEHGGNGGLEIVNWAVMAGTLPGARGERVYYEEIQAWLSGLGGVELYADQS